MSYEVETKRIAPQTIAYGTGSGTAADIPKILGEILNEVMAHVKEHKGQIVGPPFTHYLSMGQEIEIQAGLPLQDEIPAGGDVKIGKLPGGEALRVVHMGGYDKLPQAYQALAKHAQAHNLATGNTFWEFYWTDPAEEPNQENWKTEIFQPLVD